MSGEVKIFGASYVFARQKLRKPFHAEVVEILARGALCQNDCGLYYVGPGVLEDGDLCPDCGAPPKPWRVGRDVERLEVTVRMQFGNVTDVSFLRSLGPVWRRQVGVESLVRVGRKE